MHSFYFKNLPYSLSNMWTLNRTRNQDQDLPALRNEDDFYIPFARTDQTSLLPQTSFPKLWNLLPQEIRSIQNKFSFSNKLKDLYISKLSDVPNCTRLLCPACHLWTPKPKSKIYFSLNILQLCCLGSLACGAWLLPCDPLYLFCK